MLRTTIIILLTLACTSFSLNAQTPTVGVLEYDSASFAGYTLFHPTPSTTTHLIDNWGREIHSWASSYSPGMSVYLLENGHLLRTARFVTGGGGLIMEMDWDGTILWEYQYADSTVLQHHDIHPMPNGNVLILAWENLTAAEAIEAGRDSALLSTDVLKPEHVVEVQPTGPTTGDIVWEWHIWDHLIQDFDSTKANYGVVADHPELMDLNLAPDGNADWLHANSVNYNPELDQIVISLRRQDEFIVIDHSTTTAEAAGHTGGNCGMGGDIIYRWGSSVNYDAGTDLDTKLFDQHDANWIPPGLPGAGNMLVFSNGAGRPGDSYSTVEEITTTVDGNGDYPQPSSGTAHGPESQTWTYTADPPTSLYASKTSGAQRLPNGNTLICSGPYGHFYEVTADGEIVWEYINPDTRSGIKEQGQTATINGTFRCTRFAPDYPGLAGRDLTPGTPIEIYQVSIEATAHTPVNPSNQDTVVFTSKIFDDSGINSAVLKIDTGTGFFTLDMYDDGLHNDGDAGDSVYGAIIPPVSGGTTVHYYVVAEDGDANSVVDPSLAPGTTYKYSVHYDKPMILINEFLADNTTSNQDPQGQYDSWIELYNATGQEVTLAGMYLTDDFSQPDKFALPDTTMPNGSLLIVWTDGDTGDGPLHANFSLLSTGGEIGVIGSDLAFLDSLTYGSQGSDISFGRYPDGTASWQYFDMPTPGTPNAGCICGEFYAGYTGNINCSTDGKSTLSDITSLIDHIYLSKRPLCCRANGNVDGSTDGKLTLSDITSLIDHTYISKMASAPCP